MKPAKIERFYWKAVRQMWRAVGTEFDAEEARKPNWFLRRTWTEAQEEKFREWFVRHARKDLRLTKKSAENEARFFLLNWGWKNEKNPT